MVGKMKERRKKRLTGRKVTAYVVTNLIIIGMFIAVWFKTEDLLKSTMKWFLVSVLVNALMFLSLNSVDKLLDAIKSKYDNN